MNTEDGLYFVTYGLNASRGKLNKQVGDKFRISHIWHPDSTLEIYIDGQWIIDYTRIRIRARKVTK